jgi:hypothetical protein
MVESRNSGGVELEQYNVKVDNNTFPHDKHEVKTFATTPTV